MSVKAEAMSPSNVEGAPPAPPSPALSGSDAANSGDSEKKEPLNVAHLSSYEYEVAKWIAQSHLKFQRKMIKEEIIRNSKIKSLEGFSPTNLITDVVTMGGVSRESNRLQVDEYWSDQPTTAKYKGLTEPQIEALLYLQASFRTMLILKRLRDSINKNKAGLDSFGSDKAMANIMLIQAGARRLLAAKTVETKIQENLVRDENFAKFCKRMKDGVKVVMYSRKYKTAPTRIISFSDDLNNMEFTASFGSKGKVELKKIFKINTGMSGTKYGDSKPVPPSKAFCLECLGGRVVDIAADSAREARELHQGFGRLVELLAGKQSPFFIDELGIPKRAGPSIVENAIKQAEHEGDHTRKPYKSKADEMRFWSALRFLQEEYDSWQRTKDEERRQWDADQEEQARAREKTLKLEGRIKPKTEGTNKVPKLVRFEDPDTGNWKIKAVDEELKEEETEQEEVKNVPPILSLGPDVEEEAGGRKKLRRKKEKPPPMWARIFKKKPSTPLGEGGGGGGGGKGAAETKRGEPDRALFEFTLDEPVEAGATSLPLDRPKGCEAGMRVVMDKGTPLEEHRVISAFGSIILDQPLHHAHPVGATVGVYPPSKGAGSAGGSVKGGQEEGKTPPKKGFFGALFGKKEGKEGGKEEGKKGEEERSRAASVRGAAEATEGADRAPPRGLRVRGGREGSVGGGAGAGPTVHPPQAPKHLNMAVLSRMARGDRAEPSEPDSERSFVTTLSGVESIPETEWDEASTLRDPSVVATSDATSSVWSECIGTDDDPPSVASTFPGIPGRPLDDLSTVWSECTPTDDGSRGAGRGRDRGVDGRARLPVEVGVDLDNASVRTGSTAASLRRREQEEDDDATTLVSAQSDDDWSRTPSTVKSDQWSEVNTEEDRQKRRKKQSFWGRILCMAPQYADGDSDDDYFVQPEGTESGSDDSREQGKVVSTARGTPKGKERGGAPQALMSIEEGDESDEEEEGSEEEEEGSYYDGEAEEEGEGEEEEEGDEDEEYSDEDAGSEDAVTREEELDELSDEEK